MVLESVTREETAVLSATNLERVFGHRNQVRALAGVDLTVVPGRSVGIAGESGSGKSTLLKLMLALDKPSSGTVSFHGNDISAMSRDETREYRGRVQAVFQDPAGSFNPRHRIGSIITEPLTLGRKLTKDARREAAVSLLESVDLPGALATRYPHELSGGQKQRVAIARALGCQPEVVLLDEPVTALDISVRGAILNLAKTRAAEEDVTYVVVSHDLSAIYHLTDQLYVMRRGLVVESGSTVQLASAPVHPYTQRLVNAIGDPLSGYRPGDRSPAQDDAAASEQGALPLVEVGPGHYARV